jgi:predicted alpha/beta superfamily hydrolase
MKRKQSMLLLLWFFLSGVCILLATGRSWKTDSGEPIVFSTAVKIQSKILNEERRIFISVPDEYEKTREKYPVLYCMTLEDGIPFHYASGIARMMAEARIVPKMFVVGLCDIDALRDLTPSYAVGYGPTSGGAGQYLEHLKREIIPYIDGKYRTQNLRLFWGHSIEGVLGIYAFLKEPELFHAHVLSSPFFVYDGNQRYLLKNTESFIRKRNDEKNFLYITVGNEPRLKRAIEAFIENLETLKPVGVECKYTVKEREDHRSVMAMILPDGLRSVFSDWRGRLNRPIR